MSVLQVPLQSLTSNLPAFPPPRLQEGNITQNSPASSGKTYDIPVSLTPQNLHQELARAHAALLVDSTNSSLPTPESHQERSDECTNPDRVQSALAFADPHSETYNQVSERIATFSPKLSTPHSSSKKERLKRGLTTYGRLENVDREKESESVGEGVKDMWEFDQFTQDHLVTKSAKHTAPAAISIKTKPQNAAEAKGGDGVHSDGYGEDRREKRNQKQSKKVGLRKIKRSKTSGGLSLSDYGILGAETNFDDGEDDEDYSPAGNRRTVRKRVTIDPTPSNGRKKTRSNTNEWELMPALPKGRRATVLKQLEAGFVFEGGESSALPNRASPVVEPLPHNSVSALSPFKVDLAKISLSLPEEEKGNYAIFSPTATPSIPLESSASQPLPAVSPQEPLHSLTVEAANTNAAFPTKEHFRCSGALQGSSIENTQLILESISVELSQDETHDGVRLLKPTEAPVHSSSCPRKRARLKKTRTKTAITLSRERSPAPREQRSRIVAASDDEDPLSDLDEREIHPPTDWLDTGTSTPPRRLREPKSVSPQPLDLKENPVPVLSPQASKPAAGCEIEGLMPFVHTEVQLHESSYQCLDDAVTGSNTKSVLTRGKKRSKGKPETFDQTNVQNSGSSCLVSAHEDPLSDRGNYDATIESGVGTNNMEHLQVNKEGKATQKEVTPPSTPPKVNPKQLEHTKTAGGKGPHSPINGGKPPTIKFRVGLSKKANIESLHAYLRK